MNTQRLLVVLTAVNLGILSYQLVRPRPGLAATLDVPAVLRGRALEIVDERGRIRASLSVLPEDPKVKWKGQPYPETVLLRLITADGRPNVKLAESDNAAGLALGGETDETYAILKAESDESTLKLTSRNGREQIVKP